MQFADYLREQRNQHPSMEPQDVIKMCYQAAYGAEHLLSDLPGARNYLEKEYAEAGEREEDLYEQISDKVCRINLSAWKAKDLPLEWLFRMFVASCKVEPNGKEMFLEYLQEAENCLAIMPFSEKEWSEYVSGYKKNGMPAVHHSEPYRQKEKPAYRIADNRFCRMIPILEKIKPYVDDNKPCIIAIDGRAASGKTTLASCLQTITGAEVIHMDDFFLPSELRTEERLAEPGGNVHYERFTEEVLPCLSKREAFSYHIFDCSVMDYNGMRGVGDNLVRVVEGSYSLHPKYGNYADVTVFSEISPKEQLERIRKRNGKQQLEVFRNRWIPMEERYFNHCSIRDKADIKI